jgi:hypothetical protein
MSNGFNILDMNGLNHVHMLIIDVKKISNLFQYRYGVLNCYMCFNNYGKCKMQLMSNGFNMLKADGSTHVPCW